MIIIKKIQSVKKKVVILIHSTPGNIIVSYKVM